MQMTGSGARPNQEQLHKVTRPLFLAWPEGFRLLPTLTSSPPVMQWFTAIDKDGNGELTAIELQAALQLGNLNFSLATVAHIIRIHDKTGSGTITFEEFGKLHEFLTNVQQRSVLDLTTLPSPSVRMFCLSASTSVFGISPCSL